MNLEYYYLFGLDIPLEKFNLGTVKQPKIKDFIEKRIDIESFYLPFVFNKMIIDQSEDKNDLNKELDRLGSLTFLFAICSQFKRLDILMVLKRSIGMLYGDNDILLNIVDRNIVVKDVYDKTSNKLIDITIDDSNFDKLSDLVLEMYKLDKDKLKFEKKPEYDDRVISDKMLEAKRKFLEMNKGKKRKDDTLSILDIANIVIHSKGIDYENVVNMTIYQLKNSFEVLNIKESFDVSTLYRVSPKFDMSKEKYEHWTSKIKISKSRLAD